MTAWGEGCWGVEGWWWGGGVVVVVGWCWVGVGLVWVLEWWGGGVMGWRGGSTHLSRSWPKAHPLKHGLTLNIEP